MGSSPVNPQIAAWENVSFDMPALYMWEWHNDEREWLHSDIKDVPYIYVYELFGELTGK